MEDMLPFQGEIDCVIPLPQGDALSCDILPFQGEIDLIKSDLCSECFKEIPHCTSFVRDDGHRGDVSTRRTKK